MSYKENTSTYEAADYIDITDPEYVRDYLETMLEENGIPGFQRAIGHVAKAAGMTEIANKTGLGRESLYKSLSDKGNPQLDTIDKVLKALGMKLAIERVNVA